MTVFFKIPGQILKKTVITLQALRFKLKCLNQTGISLKLSMQFARTIFSDSATFIEKKRVENRLWPKSEFLWPKTNTLSPPGWACRATALEPLPSRPRRSPAAAAPLHCGWSLTRRATALGPLLRRPCRSSAAAAPLHCGWSSTSTASACPMRGSVFFRPRTPTCRRYLPARLSRRRCPRAGPAGLLRWGSCPAALAVPLQLTTYPDCRRYLPARLSWRRCPRAGPAGPLRWGRCPQPPPPFPYRCRSAPLRVVVDGHCLPHEGECLRSTTYSDCRRHLSAGLSRGRCPQAGPAGPLRWSRCPAAPAVPLPLSLGSTAGGRRRALPAPRGGETSFDHVPRLSSLSTRRAEPASLSPGWACLATALGPLPAALAVPLPLLLSCTAGGRQRPLPPPGGGVSPFVSDHVPLLPLPSTRRAEQASPPPGWARRATALGPLLRRLRRSSAAAAQLHCGWS
jgi:hypothetical protein